MKTMLKPPTSLKKSNINMTDSIMAGSASPSAVPHRPSLTAGTSSYALLLPEEYNMQLSSINDCPVSERPALILKKLKLCSFVFDFKNENPEEANAKELKTNTLLELIDHLQQPKNSFSEALFSSVFTLVSTNLFRALPPAPLRTGLDPPDEDEPTLDDAWPHLQLVYEFFTQFLLIFVEHDLKSLKKYIHQGFVISLLELFDSEDARERDCLKSILHRTYAKFMSLRTHIRTAINNVFFRFVFESHHHNGIAELLEILGSIINGFALPLKDEHKNFLVLVLTPLHKAQLFSEFYPPLSYCVCQFIEKDATLSVPVFQQLLKYWPTQNSHKEVLFLGEVDQLLEFTPPDQFQMFMVPLFKQISFSLKSEHFQVAERALYLWNNEYISTLIYDFRDILLPIVFDAIHCNSLNHWNPTVLKVSQNVLQLYIDSDIALYESCLNGYPSRKEKRENELKNRKKMWSVLESSVNKK